MRIVLEHRSEPESLSVAVESIAVSPDHLNRKFTASRPNGLQESNLTYAAIWRGFVYATFVNDA